MEHIWAGIEGLWNSILDFTTKLVIPDWASLIALLPILLLIAIVLFFVVTLARYAQLGPRRRGVRRIRPVPPAGVHEGGPSFAPILAAIGTFLLLLGLVVKGWFLVAGLAVLILTLLYWGREAIRDYEHIERPALPPGDGGAIVRTPPPGIHMPGPSFRPILVSTAVALLLVGLIAGPAVLLAGVFALIVTLVGWLRDARREYAGVVVADRTGHPPAEPIPGYPVGTLAAIALVVAAALVLNTGVLPPKGSASGGASPGASGGTGGSGGGSSGGSGGPAQSGGPAGSGGGGSGGAAADVTITAKGIAFVETTASAPAGKAFKLAFDNEDAGTPHNVAIHKDSPTGAEMFKGAIFPGVKTTVYDVPALPAGTYGFVCSVHPNMTGTLTAK
jgi:plastocyanin